MEEMSKHGKIGKAAMKAGMDRKTGRKYIRVQKLPSQMRKVRNYRTRKDPFEQDWDMIEKMLGEAPELEGKALFYWLLEQKPSRYEEGQIRTFQRKVKKWRGMKGPDKEVFFSQEHRPGEAIQTDFTNCNKLGITINGETYDHLICHPVLPYSNWEWGTVCRSESMMALNRGIQEALFHLGRVPTYSQTDNSTAATHDLRTGKRDFNKDYVRFVQYFGMKPRTIAIGQSHQNGDVESLNNVIKKRLKQHLILRGNRNFESVEAYEKWVQQEVLTRANNLRSRKVTEEIAVMRPLMVKRLQSHKEDIVRVSRESTIRVMENTYSVPSRLIGERVRVQIHDDRVEIFYSNVQQLVVERLLGKKKHRIDYHHIIWSLVNKPGAFSRYRYREELFPSLIFRKAYDRLCESLGTGYKSDKNYLMILHQAAALNEADVETALELLLQEKQLPTFARVKELVQPRQAETPKMDPLDPNLSEYDNLLKKMTEVMS
jgi:hypothetical protein